MKHSLFIPIILIPALTGCLRPFTAQPEFLGVNPPANYIWLDSLDVSLVDQEYGTAEAGKSVDEHPITLAKQVYPHGLGTHAYGEMTVDLGGAATRFRAVVGVDDETNGKGAVIFAILRDGKEVWTSRELHGNGKPEVVDIDLRGAREMMLTVRGVNDVIHSAHADWAGAMIELVPGSTFKPRAVAMRDERVPDIWRPGSPTLAINAPRIVGTTPGRAMVFRIPATGPAPIQFDAANLPPSLELDKTSGVITGSITTPGTYEIDVSASSGGARSQSKLTIVAGPNSLARTPPMGWNSWNVWGTSVDDAKVRAAADALVSTGLAAVGYQFINIDDAWEGKRDAQGRITTNEKFPDMKALALYVHSKGLKLGIYSSPGPKTCAEYEGSYQHEFDDARTWADWGIDLVKYDWCSYDKIAKDQSRSELKKPYELMRKALDECGRDIVFSLCQYGRGDVWEWGESVGGNYWRTTGDITDSWISMSDIGFGQNGHEKYAGPGHWNDPDMLVVGKLGWGPKIRPTRLSPYEQQTHITLWAMLAAPMLIGCDLSQIDDFTLALLANPEVIEINQDPLGKQGARMMQDGNSARGPHADLREIWSRPLADGSIAVALFNRGRNDADIPINFAGLGLDGNFTIRDVWRRTDVAWSHTPLFVYHVPAHGSVLIRLTPVSTGTKGPNAAVSERSSGQ